MAQSNLKYLPLDVQEWINSSGLKLCSPSAHGILINVMCLMHKETDYGKILLKDRFRLTECQTTNFSLLIGKLININPVTIKEGLAELIEEKVLVIDGEWLIKKSMVEEGEKHVKKINSKSFALPIIKKQISEPAIFDAEDNGIAFSVFWELYDYKKGDKNKLEAKWFKLKKIDKEKIIAYLPLYIKSTPEKKYRKHPETFLNNRAWEDEIVTDKKFADIPASEINNGNIHLTNLRGLELSRKINWQSYFKINKQQYQSLPPNSQQAFNQLEIIGKAKIS